MRNCEEGVFCDDLMCDGDHAFTGQTCSTELEAEMSEEDSGMELLATLVQHNVDSAAYTTNLLLKGKDDEIKMLAETIIDLAAVIDDATVMDRKTEARLRMFDFRIDHAHDVLRNLKEMA